MQRHLRRIDGTPCSPLRTYCALGIRRALLISAFSRPPLQPRPPPLTGKKRLDLAGALLAGLFRQLFRKLTQNVRKYLQLCLDKGTQFVVGTAIKSQVGGMVHP